jgi:transcriptional regulator with PAS, ATPase and Fis domain
VNSEFRLKNRGIIGDSPAMKALACQIETAARSDLTVLITGESGTGKELVARAIHEQSVRASMPFISINCGALAESLLESELFGYERGAFTGANQRRGGLFEAAHTGTIFLDEIGEMSPACQVKLLRVLQENAVRPIGAYAEISIDARVIVATNRNLAREVAVGRFREDLFYRIAVLTIDTPPLRERRSDIPLLVKHFVRQAEEKIRGARRHRIEEDAIVALSSYAWPGNVRQLHHVIERLVAFTIDEELIAAATVYRALPASLLSGATPQLHITFRENESLDDLLDRITLELYEQLRRECGSHAQVARLLRTPRIALLQRIERVRQRMQSNVVL